MSDETPRCFDCGREKPKDAFWIKFEINVDDENVSIDYLCPECEARIVSE